MDIDSQGSRHGFSTFITTARGTQFEQLEGGTADNITWTGDWKTATRRTKHGWNCEMAIPFALMRYPRGATGSGKTRLALHLLAEQINAGCSVVMLDPNIETVRHLLALAYAAGMAPEQVTVLSPYLSGAGAPGWNPLDARASGVSPAQAAADVASVLAKSTSSWGPRMGDLLANALIVVASHGLSLFELARPLQRDDYREGLLARPLPRSRNASFSGIPLDTVANVTEKKAPAGGVCAVWGPCSKTRGGLWA